MLPFVLNHLFKDVCVAKKLERQRQCLPPEQRACLLAIYYKIFRFPKSTGIHSVNGPTPKPIYMAPVEAEARRGEGLFCGCRWCLMY